MPTKKLPRRNCRNCGKECNRPEKFYCTIVCQQRYQTEIKIKNSTLGHVACKAYLLRTRGWRCEICKLSEWLGNKIPLVLDHIDGNGLNNNIHNLRLVCGNCDMLLPTYKKRNVGKGRSYRRERYSKGLTY